MKRKNTLLIFLLLPFIFYSTSLASTTLQLEEQVEQLIEKIKSRDEKLRQDYASLYADKVSGSIFIIGSRQSCQGEDLNYATDNLGLPFLETVPRVDGEAVANYAFSLRDIMDLNYTHKNPNGFGMNISLRSVASSLTKDRLLLNLQSAYFTSGQFELIAGDFETDYTPLMIWGKKSIFEGSAATSFDLVAHSRGWEKGAYPLKGLEVTFNSDEGFVTGLYHNSAVSDVLALRSVFSLGKRTSASFNVVRILNNPLGEGSVFGGDILVPIGRNKIKFELQRSQLNQAQSGGQFTPLVDTAWSCTASGPLLGLNFELMLGATGDYYWAPLGEKDFSMGYNLSRSSYANPFLDNDSPVGPDFDYFNPGIAEPGREYYKYKLKKRLGNISLGFNTASFKCSKLNQEELSAGTWDLWVENRFYCEVFLGKTIGLPFSLKYQIHNDKYRMVEQVQDVFNQNDYVKTTNGIGFKYQAANGSVIETEFILTRFPTDVPSKRRSVVSAIQYPLGTNAFAVFKHTFVSSSGEEGFNFIGNGVWLNIGYHF